MDPFFAPIAVVCIGSALMVVTRENPVYSAVWLLVCFLTFAVIYLRLSAPFLAAIHVLVYTGAILVLFLFVIMLLNLQPDELGEEYPIRVKAVAAAMCTGLCALIAVPMMRDPAFAGPLPATSETFGSVASVGRVLFIDYALHFELVSVLIIVAMFGSMVLAKKSRGSVSP